LSYSPQKNVLVSCGGKDDRRVTFWDLNLYKPFRII
jgi:WD40 repeat protein